MATSAFTCSEDEIMNQHLHIHTNYPIMHRKRGTVCKDLNATTHLSKPFQDHIHFVYLSIGYMMHNRVHKSISAPILPTQALFLGWFFLAVEAVGEAADMLNIHILGYIGIIAHQRFDSGRERLH